MKFLRIVARKNGFRRAGVEHSGSPVYYPLAKINPDEVTAYAKQIQKAGGELKIFFTGKDGQERGQFTPQEIESLKKEPMLVVDEIEVNLEVTAPAPEKTDEGKSELPPGGTDTKAPKKPAA